MTTALISNTGPVSPSGMHSLKIPMPGVLPRQENKLAAIPFWIDPSPRSAVPEKVLFGGLRHPALRMLHAIPLRTETTETGGVSVIWDEGNEFGVGDTFGEAMEDFGVTISELFIELGEAPKLSQDLSVLRHKLSTYIAIRQR